MKSIKYLFVTFLIFALLALLYSYLNKKTSPPPRVTKPIIANPVRLQSKDCPITEAVIKKLVEIGMKFPQTNDKHRSQLLMKDNIIKDLEKFSAWENDLGNNCKELLYNIQFEAGFESEALKTYQTLVKSASKNNHQAIISLCLLNTKLRPSEETIGYCEKAIMYNDSDFNGVVAYNKYLIFKILEKYYYKQNKIDRFAEICLQNKDERIKVNCTMSFYDRANKFYNDNNFIEAFNLHKKASTFDIYGINQYSLALMYHTGKGVNEDHNAAIYWYLDALGKLRKGCSNVPKILYNLGCIYSRNNDYIKAFYYYHKSAVMGDSCGQYSLAVMYADGHGVLKNFQQAYAWDSIAIAKGLDHYRLIEAEKLRERLSIIITDQDLSGNSLKEAKDLAKQYYEKYL